MRGEWFGGLAQSMNGTAPRARPKRMVGSISEHRFRQNCVERDVISYARSLRYLRPNYGRGGFGREQPQRFFAIPQAGRWPSMNLQLVDAGALL